MKYKPKLADVPELKEPIAGDQFIKYDPVKDVSLFYRGHFGGKEQYFTVKGSYDTSNLVRGWDEKEKKCVDVVPPQYKMVDRKGRFTFDRVFHKFVSSPSQVYEQAAPEDLPNDQKILHRLDRIEKILIHKIHVHEDMEVYLSAGEYNALELFDMIRYAIAKA